MNTFYGPDVLMVEKTEQDHRYIKDYFCSQVLKVVGKGYQKKDIKPVT